MKAAVEVTDGLATLVHDGAPEGWMPYRAVFDTLWWGRRHVLMGASQIDRYGNQNIAAIGDWAKPKAMLLGVRGERERRRHAGGGEMGRFHLESAARDVSHLEDHRTGEWSRRKFAVDGSAPRINLRAPCSLPWIP